MPNAQVDEPGFWDQWPETLADYKAELESMEAAKCAYFPLGDTSTNPPTVVALYLPPNAVLDRHAHNCERFEIIARGELHADGKVLRPGDVMYTHPGVAYGPHRAGPEGVLTYEIFSNYAASYQPILFPNGESEEGEVYDVSVAGTLTAFYANAAGSAAVEG
jgi:hypothetical protein